MVGWGRVGAYNVHCMWKLLLYKMYMESAWQSISPITWRVKYMYGITCRYCRATTDFSDFQVIMERPFSSQQQQRFNECKKKNIKAKNDYVLSLESTNKFMKTYFNKYLRDIVDVSID